MFDLGCLRAGTAVALAILSTSCAAGSEPAPAVPPTDGSFQPADTAFESGELETGGEDGFVLSDSAADASTETGILDPDAACASSSVEAKAEVLPVDIIWIVDNSNSMKPAVDQVTSGLNAFAKVIDTKKLDYKVIMLSKRGSGGTGPYPVCIPPPLAGDASCGNGPRFFHSNVDIKSTQPLEQFLGTLDQTEGYKVGQTRGGEPWKDQLRAGATKSIVIVSDDNSRLSADQFEHFVGGNNPVSTATPGSLVLPPGVLDPSRKGMFDGYVFHGVYNWGSETDPGVKCTYPSGAMPTGSAGFTYTTLVKKTGGSRAKVCDDAATAWPAFLDAVATAVVKSSKLSCTLDLPMPSMGTLDPTAVNVEIDGATGKTLVPKVKDAASCGSTVAWYYDDDLAPTKVLLCPGACDAANAAVGVDKPGKISILFGCKTVIK